ncbi:MAG: YqiA/YcfP family alpha/beta fold hydrolase [Thermoanaerobaculia bacterium]|jgi:pimeloyl-ACP methyl ester carboxylesterase
MPTRILYLHGFASSPNGEKVHKLRGELGPAHELVAPDLNAPSFAELDFGAIVERALSAALDTHPDVIVGSSLGSLVALSVARRGIDAPLVLIAPAFGIADRWLSKLPDGDPITVFNHATGGDTKIHRAFFLDMANLTIDREPPAAPVVVFMGRMDESVPFERVESTWSSWERSGRLAPGSKFIEIANGDHRLVDHAGLIAAEIRRAAGSV